MPSYSSRHSSKPSSSRERSRSPLSTAASASTRRASNRPRCRICSSTTKDACNEPQPVLENLCNCRGSIGGAHVNCLKLWLERTLKVRCELCGADYPLWLVPSRALEAKHRQEVEDLFHRHQLQWEERRSEILHRRTQGQSRRAGQQRD